MPTPLELLLDPVSLAVFAIYARLIAVGGAFSRAPLPRRAGWRLTRLAAFAAYFFLSSYLPLLWAESLAPLQIVDLTCARHPRRRGRRRAGLRGRRVRLASQHARLDRTVARCPSDASQRRARRYLRRVLVQPARHGRLDGAVQPGADAGRRTDAAGRVRDRVLHDLPVGVPAHQRAHAALARRTSCSGPRAIRVTTPAACTPGTTPTCRCSTSCSAH